MLVRHADELFSSEKIYHISGGTEVLPELDVQSFHLLARDYFQSDLVGEGLGMIVRRMGEDPHVSDLVGEGRDDLFVVELVEKCLLELDSEALSVQERFHGYDSVVLGHDDHLDWLAHFQRSGQSRSDLFELGIANRCAGRKRLDLAIGRGEEQGEIHEQPKKPRFTQYRTSFGLNIAL